MFRSLNKILSGLIAKNRKPKAAAGKKPTSARKNRNNPDKRGGVDSSPITGQRPEAGSKGEKKAFVKKGAGSSKRTKTVAPGGNKAAADGKGFASNGNKGGKKVAPGGIKAGADGKGFASNGNKGGKKVAPGGKGFASNGNKGGNKAAADGNKVDLSANKAVKGGDKSVAGSVKRKARKNKHGIPLLSSKDISFGVEPELLPKADLPGELPPLENSAGTAKKNRQRKTPVKKDKNGFPVLASREDFYDLFSVESIDQGGASKACFAPPMNGAGSLSRNLEESFGEKRDRHGLPLIDGCDDLFGLFDADRFDELNPPGPHVEEQPERDEDDFEKMLEASIGKKSYRTLLKEKDDNFGRKKPLTMAQKLKKYPDPQGQLDLHGYTSYQAEERTDSYILQELGKGTKTVRIIVGKGLHSEGRAVLPDVVEDRIVELKKKGKVLTFKWENGSKSKSGAMIVYLI